MKMSYFSPYSYSKKKKQKSNQIYLIIEQNLIQNHKSQFDKSQFAKKDDLAKLKSEGDKLDIDKLYELDPDKLKPVPVDLSTLSDVVNDDIVKKMYVILISKILKSKYLMLLPQLLILLLMLK